MKGAVSSFLLGVIAAFGAAQISVLLQHGFSFMVAFSADPFFILRGLFWAAILLLGYFVLRIIQGQKVGIELGRFELGAFALGTVAMFALAIWLRSFEPTDYKVFPYIVIPRLFFVALASFWLLVLLNFRPNKSLQATPKSGAPEL
jgi:hypothetical protein